MVVVSVSVLSGSLSGEVAVRLATIGNTATGKNGKLRCSPVSLVSIPIVWMVGSSLFTLAHKHFVD